MIGIPELRQYFDAEAEASRRIHNALMALPVEERVRRRRCISGVAVQSVHKPQGGSGEYLVRLSCERNISDFREGESLFLHQDGQPGMQCTLAEFAGDDGIVVSVYQRTMAELQDILRQRGLILDKAVVDLRASVYDKYLYSLPEDGADSLSSHLVNTRPAAHFVGRQACAEELDRTLSRLGMSLMDSQREAVLNSMAADNLYLIQGPPGTGKSFVLALVMMEELLFFGRKVAVVGPNHMAVNNALRKLAEICPQATDSMLKIGQWYNAPAPVTDGDGHELRINNVERLDVGTYNGMDRPFVYGLTPHALYTSRARGLQLDTLFVDEAGQETVPLAMMAMSCACKVILAGDHRQLPPIVADEGVPEELRESVFRRLMRGDNCTMLDTTFRMCGPVCSLVSDLFYGGALRPLHVEPSDRILSDDPLISFDSPVVFCDVPSDGRQSSFAEAKRAAEICREFISAGLPADQICVISPFRAQAAEVRRALRKEGIGDGIAADTVDRMQGQEREAVIVSLTAGDLDYMLEMGEFLYSPNKLNVSFSRAKSKLVILGNREMLRRVGECGYPLVGKILDYAILSMKG